MSPAHGHEKGTPFSPQNAMLLFTGYTTQLAFPSVTFDGPGWASLPHQAVLKFLDTPQQQTTTKPMTVRHSHLKIASSPSFWTRWTGACLTASVFFTMYIHFNIIFQVWRLLTALLLAFLQPPERQVSPSTTCYEMFPFLSIDCLCFYRFWHCVYGTPSVGYIYAKHPSFCEVKRLIYSLFLQFISTKWSIIPTGKEKNPD